MKIKCRKYNLLLDSDLLNGFPDAGDGVQHKTRQSYEDAHENESFIVGAEGIVHITCIWLDVRKYSEDLKKNLLPTVGGPARVATPWKRRRRPKEFVNFSGPKRSARTSVVSRT